MVIKNIGFKSNREILPKPNTQAYFPFIKTSDPLCIMTTYEIDRKACYVIIVS
jgi:hypothetical protein